MRNVTAAEIRLSAENLAPLESQKEYRHRLSEFIRMHNARVYALDTGIKHAALPTNSMLIIAQTGCGKSYTATRLAEAAGVDLITIDCSSLTRAGYKGCNLSDLLNSAYKDAKDKERFSRSIILFDEADKLYLDGTEGNPQVNFLKLFDGSITSENRSYGSCQAIDTTRMSFLFAGAFCGLDEIVRRRLKPTRSIGFRTEAAEEVEDGDLMAMATMADIKEYGFMEELLGRIGTLCYIPPLTPADYRTLIKGSSGSTICRCNNLLQGSGVTMDITDSACAYIAREAGKSALGARAVEPIVFGELRKALCHIDEDTGINHISLACRNDRLALRYSRGLRIYPEGMEPKEKLPTPPDVSIASYLTSQEGIDELCTLALNIFDKPRTKAEKTLDAYLRCTLLFMSTLGQEKDKVLSSLSKLADTTERTPTSKTTVYDRIITEKLKKTYPDDFGNRLSEAYDAFKRLEKDDTHFFLTNAVMNLRQSWYQGLLDATCA